MPRWNIGSYPLVILSTALLTTTAVAQSQKVGPAAAPAIRAAPAPAPHIAAPAPAPRIAPAAPHISAPRVAPQIATPRVAPQHIARPPGAPSPGVVTRHIETPRAIEGAQRERQIGGRNPGNQGDAQAGRDVSRSSPD